MEKPDGRSGRADERIASSVGGVRVPSSDLTSTILRRLSERGDEAARYSARDELAHGGQGRVVRVWDEELGRALAMKVTHESQDAIPEKPLAARALGRFLEEARLTAQLDHPGIVPVHDLGLDSQGRVFFTMKLVKGRDLKAIFGEVARGEEGWTQTRALSVLLRVCEAMAYAHSKGVIHRDLKPANVMVGRFGEVYVMDWGLARVLDQPETRELRLESKELVSVVHSLRHGPGSEELDASLVTLDGDVVGTPAYMAPEQAAGHLEAMGPHSDVYSAGAMLYHLFAGHPPYLPAGTRLNNYAIWSRVQEGPPAPLHERAKDVPAELIAITEKAMARDTALRYRDMSELAEDLRAYLEHRVVHAYETGAVAELRKWVGRNRSLAAALAAGLLIAFGGLARTSYVEARERAVADEQRGRALASEKRATENAEEAARQALRAQEEGDNVKRLSAFQNLEELQQRAQELWPIAPERVSEYQQWLREAQALVAALHDDPRSGAPGHDSLLKELRQRAEPQTSEESAARLAAHPRRVELENLRERIHSVRSALDVSAGRAQPADWEPAEVLPETFKELNELAWSLVDPERTEFGREAEGLGLARLAFEVAGNEQELADSADTLAWALHCSGLDEEALEVAREACAAAGPLEAPDLEAYRARLQEAIATRRKHGAHELERLERRAAILEWELTGRRFADAEDRWWYASLVRLVGELEDFSDPLRGLISGVSSQFGWGIERRLEWALSLELRTLSGAEARARWEEAVATIADPSRAPEYRGLRIRPQLGLVPIGRDPQSRLYEFADLVTGNPPERDAQGKLELGTDSALVFVLIPGGTFWLGAQSTNSQAPNYDPLADGAEGPPIEVELGPFLISKYELSQAQWKRWLARNPSTYKNLGPSQELSLLRPIESVSWEEFRGVLRRYGLELPTEAQWEYAARAGTSTAWWAGSDLDELRGAANVWDRSALRAAPEGQRAFETSFEDGFPRTAPVDALRANGFGLHGIIGNVSEWCEDGYLPDAYRQARRRDPVCTTAWQGYRVTRGGSLDLPPDMARSSTRLQQFGDFAGSSIGVRPVRRLVE